MVILIVVGVVFYRNYSSKLSIVLNGKTFVLEVANTDATIKQGLSGHAPLADDGGMLFIFPTAGNYGFWMKDMLFPLDIIWINSNFQIVHVEQNLTPASYPTVYYPNADALYVIEINAGQTAKLNIHEGDTVQLKISND